MAIPLEMSITGNYKHALVRLINVEHYVTPEQSIYLQFLGLLSLIGFIGGSFIVSNFSPKNLVSDENRFEREVILGMLIVSSASLFILYGSNLLGSEYKSLTLLKSASPLFNYLSLFSPFAASVLAMYLLIKRNSPLLVVFSISIITILFGILLKDKDAIFFGLIPLMFYVLDRWAKNNLRTLLFSISIILLFPLISLTFSLSRSGNIDNFSGMIEHYGFFRSTDARGNIIVMTDLLNTADLEHTNGKTYLTNSILWVPKILFPHRPNDLAEDFAQKKMREYSPGKGIGYSLLGESYLNFGWFGPVIQYAIIISLWLILWQHLMGKYVFRSSVLFQSFYFVSTFYILATMHRGATNYILTNFIQLVVPFAILFGMISLLKSRNHEA